MNDHPILLEIAKADRAINEADYSTLSDCYTEDAVMVIKSDKIARGREEIIAAHKKIAEYFNDTLKVTQGKMMILKTGDTALVLSQTFVESPGKQNSEYSKERKATYIYRKDKNGKWLCSIDNSYGTELLNN